MTRKLLPFLFAAVCLATVACNNANDNPDALQGEIRIDGSSTVFPISEAVAEEFRIEQPKVKVTVGVSGTGGGFKKFGRGEIDMNNASRHIKGEEIEICKQNNISYTDVMVAYDGLTVVVHPQNTWVTHITAEELKMMWAPEAQGKITRWNQIRPEWPNEEFRLYGAGTESGTYDYFTEAIVGKAHSSRGDYTASEDDNVLVQGISGDKNALGFFGFAYYIENKDKLKVVPVNGVTPSVETVKNKSYTPLSRPLYLYINSKAAARPEVQSFMEFYFTNGGALAQEVGFIALTDDEYRQQQEKFSAFVNTLGGNAAAEKQ